MKYARWLLLAILAASSLYPCSLSAQAQPDLSGLSSDDRGSIESACSLAKYIEGPAAYHRYLQTQLSALSGSTSPDLSGLSSDDRGSIESVCSHAKYIERPATYHRCLQTQLSTLAGSTSPDVSGLSSDDRGSIESVCSHAKCIEGPAIYHRCLQAQLSALSGSGTSGVVRVSGSAQQTNTEFKELKYFVGTWTITGEAKASLLGPPGTLAGTHRNELGSDGSSVISYWEEERSGSKNSGQAVYRYDSANKTYTYHSVDVSGETEYSVGTLSGPTWTWLSTLTLSDGTAVSGRFTVREESTSAYTLKFEIQPANGAWAEVMEGRASRQK